MDRGGVSESNEAFNTVCENEKLGCLPGLNKNISRQQCEAEPYCPNISMTFDGLNCLGLNTELIPATKADASCDDGWILSGDSCVKKGWSTIQNGCWLITHYTK